LNHAEQQDVMLPRVLPLWLAACLPLGYNRATQLTAFRFRCKRFL